MGLTVAAFLDRGFDLEVVEGSRLLCDRARTGELFGFEHRLEIYVPAPQRRWGYYVLPILHRERLVARADMTLDRTARVLQVHALYREAGVRWTPALDRAVTRALERLAAWRGATGLAGSDG
ncbi:MAG: winged helix DNA-binding domain-containing protein [Actinobacteria bacterium]|nr:winged helix DNA-binding domain-containing protein [Actinomycetota bacterium]